MDGKMPTASIEEYMADTDMKELEVRAYSIEEALKEAKNYLEHMRELALKIRSEADEKDEFAWVNLMEDHVAGYDKQIWFMNQSLV
ncbi:hypothetical protein SDC9_180269 [bioreactor metagenome]|uniref:Ferritin/DPS protein domain-containing protein n=1 Tax=bioreactor metagenome TaxID=1076179 RepID=A0A645H458_9ZZZZ